MAKLGLYVSLFIIIFSTLKAEKENNIKLIWNSDSSLEMKVGDARLNILLKPSTNIPDHHTPCLFQGKVDGEEWSEVAVSGCHNTSHTVMTIFSSQVPASMLEFSLVGGSYDNITHESDGHGISQTDSGKYGNDAFDPPHEIDGHDISHIERVKGQANSGGYGHDADYPPHDPFRSAPSTLERVKRQANTEGYGHDADYPPHDPLRSAPSTYKGPLPKKVVLKIDIMYDNSIRKYFGNSKNKIKNMIDRVVGLSRPLMAHATLIMRVDIKIGKIGHVDETITASLSKRDYITNKYKPQSMTSYFGMYDGDEEGNIGVAWYERACRNTGHAMNIVEFEHFNEKETARTFVHEIGHNFDMWHDEYLGCTRGAGLMSTSKGTTYDRWTSCSNRRFENWWRKEGHVCVKEVKGTSTTSSPPTGNCKCINPWAGQTLYQHIGDPKNTCKRKYCYVSCASDCSDKKTGKRGRWCSSKKACN